MHIACVVPVVLMMAWAHEHTFWVLCVYSVWLCIDIVCDGRRSIQRRRRWRWRWWLPYGCRFMCTHRFAVFVAGGSELEHQQQQISYKSAHIQPKKKKKSWLSVQLPFATMTFNVRRVSVRSTIVPQTNRLHIRLDQRQQHVNISQTNAQCIAETHNQTDAIVYYVYVWPDGRRGVTRAPSNRSFLLHINCITYMPGIYGRTDIQCQ